MTEEMQSRGERTRSEIILAAHDLFIQQGYHGTSMRQIARQAGIALGGLYNHFESKEQVFKAVLMEYHPYRQVLPDIAEVQGENVEQFLRSALHRMIQTMRERPDFMNLMFIEIVEFKSVHVRELFDLIVPQVTPIIRTMAQVNRDELRPFPPLILMRIFIGFFFAYYLTDIVIASNAPQEFRKGAEEYFTEVMLHGILVQPTPGQTELS
jgi:AcrR family transcriptional regulator